MDNILLIDAHNQLWRASIGFGPPKQIHTICTEECNHKLNAINIQHCSCGQEWKPETNRCISQASQDFVLVYNFFRSLRSILEQFSPDKCFFVLEGHPQFRYDLFADYKANRIVKNASKKDTMDKFHTSKKEVIRLMQFLPITTAKASHYECDDVISTLCDNMKDENITVLSNDSDYIQILQRGYKNCRIYNPIKKEFMEAPNYPYVAWKSLNGDKSDNIPALLKPKKALDTVTNPELFEKFLQVEENRANFSINRQLIEFRSVPEEDIEFSDGIKNFSSLKEEFTKMQFESMINEKYWGKFVNTFNCLKY
jgi:5'-3' exonuclease